MRPRRRWALLVSVTVSAAVEPASETHPAGLAVFTLIRGGPSKPEYESFINSRRCLRDAAPGWLQFDDIAFHEGNVPAELQIVLQQQV